LQIKSSVREINKRLRKTYIRKNNMKITKQYLNKNIAVIALCFISHNVSTSEGPQKSRDRIFTEAVEFHKQRIMELSIYTATRNRFKKVQDDMALYQALKIKELQEDQEYQKNFAEIKKEIQRSAELCKQNGDLSNAECEHVVTALTKQFIPT
jgi:hypothetical protein